MLSTYYDEAKSWFEGKANNHQLDHSTVPKEPKPTNHPFGAKY
jgi:hypothetical protein